MAAKDPATVPFQVRLTAEEKQAFSDAAEMRGLNLSTWARLTMRAQCSRDFTAVGRVTPFPEGKMRKQRTADELTAPAQPVPPVVVAEIAAAAREGTRVACVLAEDPTRAAVVPTGGMVDAAGRIYDRAGVFIGTAVLPTHAQAPVTVSREAVRSPVDAAAAGVQPRGCVHGFVHPSARCFICEPVSEVIGGTDIAKPTSAPKDDFEIDDVPVSSDPPEE